jgi:hypothetical protein
MTNSKTLLELVKLRKNTYFVICKTGAILFSLTHFRNIKGRLGIDFRSLFKNSQSDFVLIFGSKDN